MAVSHMLQAVHIVLLAAFYSSGVLGDNWRDGRATFFADTNDPWQISRGHCQYGYLSPKHCTGWDVAAVADQNWDYNRGNSNCGMCYEVRCSNGWITDGYGENFDRNICYDESKSVVVQVVDLCECNYAPNYYSNKRWCCGDKQHLDLSVFAFEKLMPKGMGVAKIQYRQVDCNYNPPNEAQTPSNPTPMNSYEKSQSEWRTTDPRECNGRPNGRKAPPRRNPPRKPGGGGGGSNVRIGQWSINSWTGTGINGRRATACGTMLPWGGFTFQGGLTSKKGLDVWVKKEWGNLPNMVFHVQGSGGCKRSRHISSVPQKGWNGDYVKFRVNLRTWGCKGVSKVVLQNNIGNWGWQNVCIDSVRAI